MMVTRFSSLGQILTQCWFFLAIVFVCASAPVLWAQTRHEKIVFSIPSRSIAAIDLYVAKERGFFRDEGLDVDIVQIRGNVVTVLTSKAMDVKDIKVADAQAVLQSAKVESTPEAQEALEKAQQRARVQLRLAQKQSN